MSLTVFIRMENNKTHEVELGGRDTVKDLYKKAGEAAGVEVGTFLLHFEGEELDETLGGNEIQHLGMWEGCELLLCCNVRNTMCVLSQELSSEETKEAIEQRLEEDPGLLLQVEVSGVDCLELHAAYLPSGLRHLQMTDPKQCVTSIADGFLFECRSLVTLDLTSLQCVRKVGKRFLAGCTLLQAIDLTPLRDITYTNYSFLADCNSLTEVDLGPLQNVTEVGGGFMAYCKSLKTLDLSPLRNVRGVGHWFLNYCSSLTSVDLGLRDVVSVGDFFLRNCTSLTSVDFSAMRNLTKLGDGFLSGCSSLTTANLGHLRKGVTDVGDDFMRRCNKVPFMERRRPGKCCVLC